MTASPSEDPIHAATASTAPPKKRRRRTGTGGAQDDCFTCRKRAVCCDRKRPYCTPCIEIGKDCSGYKTTLTWGVGVASRGKLRGLSSPVASRKADGSVAGSTKPVAKRRKSSLLSTSFESSQTPTPSMSNQAMAPPETPTEHEPTFPPPRISIPTPQMQEGWQVPGFLHHRQLASSQPPPGQLQTAITPNFEHDGYPLSAMSMSSYADEWNSPSEYPHTPASGMFSDQHQHIDSYMDIPSFNSATDSYPHSLSSSVDSLQSFGSAHIEQTPVSSFSHALFSEDFLNAETQEQEDNNRTDEMSLINSSFDQPFFFISPRLQSLISYYDKHICPFLVAFDDPSNPYRMHIINLATQNEGLQHAIAALATNNMRMRQIESRNPGFASEITSAFDGREMTQPTAEESCYKQLSIEQLNIQLADPRAAQDDSVLATLLVLCLFHVCDTGFSKFKTQLAGVQKLMSMRDPSTKSTFTGWVEMFFTWFDVMTSAVNDREAQVQGENMDMLDFNSNLGALEQFSGCDGRLFKLIARLGRLNLLSQGRPVTSKRTKRSSYFQRQRDVFAGQDMKWSGMGGKSDQPLSALDYEFIDGNGWGTPIISDEDPEYLIEDLSRPAFDDRREFWAEWHEIRIRLTEWEMDFSTMPTALESQSDPARLAAEQRDLLHISESFRYSALLYVTRLAHPFLPSAAPEFQQTVSLVLYHITALPITSCVNKFLLWPLFIAGTEAVDAGHRDLIRQRCIEIQRESGFFNNISCLEVLERVWMDGELGVGPDVEILARRRDSEAPPGCKGRHAFRWRRAMDRVDGEYIMI